LSQFVCLVSGDEYQLVINDSVAGAMHCGYYGDGFRGALRHSGRLYETSWLLQSITTGAAVTTSGFDEAFGVYLFVVAVCQLSP
jgi:hypothetical protein